MARSAPKSKKSKAAPKSKKVEEKEPEVNSEEERDEKEEDVEDDVKPEDENNGNAEEESDVEEEPPAKKGKGKGRPAAKKTPAKKGGRPRKTPAKKEESSEEEEEKEYEVQEILNERNRKGQKEYLVRWKGYRVNQSTWEPESNLSCDDAIATYLDKKKETKNTPAKELREVPKQTQRYAEIAGSGQEHRMRHSRRNAKSPRKTYREAADSD